MARRSKAAVAVSALLAVGATAAGAVGWSTTHTGQDTKATAPVRVRTATVTRTDLSDSRTLPGTLGFGRSHVLRSTSQGVVTLLPKPGARAARGKALYRIDDRPVPVFFGDTPFFRTLAKTGVRGHDVSVLADNLRALGYDTGPAVTPAGPGEGEEFTPALAAALKRWQHDTGQDATGTLVPGRAVVLPGPVRVDTVEAQPGDAADAALLTYTSAAKSVTVAVEATDVGTIKAGHKAHISLPDGRTIRGTVTTLGRTVQGGGTAQDTAEQTGPATIDVTVVPDRAADVQSLDAAAVQVRFDTTTRKGVLAVPVSALVALREGGYALQRPDGTLVAVTTGMFAGGLVEVSGKALTDGLKVVTAS
ncbi:efflux RND transporter periplasmic adaptor subunit [Streptomyces brasiliensis]|uniref:Peptidoglycan-binding protein n=1 Tax=Streptomyces brasiliensis TaxID=1954 RepID=A0A917KV79_9ACTN|nr:efflux RND transporter periplasmic adaptor subunit [Streptomyces brasiliensis]GGJ28327.1 peptidoglycan-binding protein [Streptomyces brasiliensis]